LPDTHDNDKGVENAYPATSPIGGGGGGGFGFTLGRTIATVKLPEELSSAAMLKPSNLVQFLFGTADGDGGGATNGEAKGCEFCYGLMAFDQLL
jgi:hypothetical protein